MDSDDGQPINDENNDDREIVQINEDDSEIHEHRTSIQKLIHMFYRYIKWIMNWVGIKFSYDFTVQMYNAISTFLYSFWRNEENDEMQMLPVIDSNETAIEIRQRTENLLEEQIKEEEARNAEIKQKQARDKVEFQKMQMHIQVQLDKQFEEDQEELRRKQEESDERIRQLKEKYRLEQLAKDQEANVEPQNSKPPNNFKLN